MWEGFPAEETTIITNITNITNIINITYIINIIFISGRQAALERVASLRKGNNIESHTVVVGVESFLYEVTEGL